MAAAIGSPLEACVIAGGANVILSLTLKDHLNGWLVVRGTNATDLACSEHEKDDGFQSQVAALTGTIPVQPSQKQFQGVKSKALFLFSKMYFMKDSYSESRARIAPSHCPSSS